MIQPKMASPRPCWRGALVALLAAWLLPLPAHAFQGCQPDPLENGTYREATGPFSLFNKLAPGVVTLDKSSAPGTIVYDSPLPPVPWVCVGDSLTTHPFLSPGPSMSIVLKALAKVGLKLVIYIDNYPPWEPTSNTTDDRAPLINVNYAPKSATDPTPVAHGVLRGRLQLVTVTPPERPTRAFLPAMGGIVELHPGYWTPTNKIQIGSLNDTTVSLIPKCIAKISTPGTVNLGRAYGLASLPLPSQVNFTLYADFDESCDGGFRIVDLGPLVVPLTVRFQPEGNQELTPLKNAIVLKNSDGQPNGLALRIKAEGVYSIKFNEWRNVPTSLSVSTRPLPLYYGAQLQKTGAPLVPGEFSQQVTIQVTFQ
ncbi:hypothetical protein [Achromobacter xylosoxidans]|uniref:hypothetical protein n=1 Tax=Alcaligenes xylosoxydans xylosoxydans TaxID=85698 RepID=UPI0006C5B67A|nr:hypothetical protein [Achromobacter xylosoxidans]CUJ70932.1 Uncharacterised protein [Achromobacter xylosoxidans]